MKKILIPIFLIFFFSGCGSTEYKKTEIISPNFNTYQENLEDDFDYGYGWAEDNDINNFDDCQNEFGTGEAEDGCNDYVKENYSGYNTFYDYECTEDCSGHEAGYEWAEDNDISDTYDCDGNSQSFTEGCEAYVEENY